LFFLLLLAAAAEVVVVVRAVRAVEVVVFAEWTDSGAHPTTAVAAVAEVVFLLGLEDVDTDGCGGLVFG